MSDLSEPNLEADLKSCTRILGKVQDEAYAQNLYAAMCNREFQRQAVMPILKDQVWSCSWRYAGGIVAALRGEGDYLDWYCSGSLGNPDNHGHTPRRYVGEGHVTEEVREDLARLGWLVLDAEEDQ